jgi:hypothetical protein
MNLDTLKNAVFHGAISGAAGAFTGQILEGKPVTYAVASGLFTAMSIGLDLSVPKSNNVTDTTWRRFLITGGSLALTAAIVAKLGLAAVSLTPANALVATGAVLAHSFASSQKLGKVTDPGNNNNNSYSLAKPWVPYVKGASQGVMQVCAFGMNPAIMTVSVVNNLLLNTDYQIFGCVDRTMGRTMGSLVMSMTGTVWTVGQLQMNPVYLAASAATVVMCNYLTKHGMPSPAF